MSLTLLLLAVYAGIILKGIRLYPKYYQEKQFMAKDQTTILKGLCCILVILVDIPVVYANRLQDMVGSFAYIAVTLYFLISAYGLRFSFENKKNYANNFIRNRVVPLLIPFAAIISLKYLLGFDPFVGGLRFVYALVLLYALTYISYKLNVTEGIVCGGVILYSLVGYVTNIGFGWNVEALGFLYGFLLEDAKLKDKIIRGLQRHWNVTLLFFLCSSGVLGILYLKYKPVYFWGEYLLRSLLGFVLVALVLTVMYRVKLGNKANTLLGKVSYEIYLTHGLVISVLSLAGNHWRSGVFIALTVVLSILIAIPWHRFNQDITNRIKTQKEK